MTINVIYSHTVYDLPQEQELTSLWYTASEERFLFAFQGGILTMSRHLGSALRPEFEFHWYPARVMECWYIGEGGERALWGTLNILTGRTWEP
jgi:hypothetical protein